MNIFVDFDGVISNSVKTIVDMYNHDFGQNIDWTTINSWDFEGLDCVTSKGIDTYFNRIRFFEYISLMPNVKYAIKKLAEKYGVIVVSMGDKQNLLLKEVWLEKYFPMVKFIGCNFADHKDKSHIDMSGDVFIDDLADNLKTSNAAVKICFGDVYTWNENWDGIRCFNWFETLRYLGIELNV